jgi:hypothetical protein
MKMKVLITIEDNKMRVCSNGEIQVFVEHMDGLNGIETVEASEIPIADFEALIKGRFGGEPKDAGREDWIQER